MNFKDRELKNQKSIQQIPEEIKKWNRCGFMSGRLRRVILITMQILLICGSCSVFLMCQRIVPKRKYPVAACNVCRGSIINCISGSAKLTTQQVEAEIDKNDVIYIEPSDSALIMIDALPDTTFKGVVT